MDTNSDLQIHVMLMLVKIVKKHMLSKTCKPYSSYANVLHTNSIVGRSAHELKFKTNS